MNLQSRRMVLVHTVTAIAVTVTGPWLTLPAAAANKGPTTHIVEITKFQFQPENLLVKPGDTIIWKNLDIVAHTATANDHGWDTGTIEPKHSISLVITKDMIGGYFCRFHPHMKAKMEVSG